MTINVSQEVDVLKPAVTISTGKDTNIVKDPYQDKVIKDVNTYKGENPFGSDDLSSFIKGPNEFKDKIVKLKETFENVDLGKDLVDSAKDVTDRIKDTLSGDYGSFSELGDNLKKDLVSGVVAGAGLDPNFVNNLMSLDPDDLIPSADELIGPGAELIHNLTGLDTSSLEVQIDGVKEILNCNPKDLKGIASILDSLTGNTGLLGIVDIGSLTSTISTVMKFADKWNIPKFVDIAIDTVDDKKLKRDMLVKGALSAAAGGNLPLTKYYTDKLSDASLSDSLFDFKGSLTDNSTEIVTRILKNYRIANEDKNKSDTRLGDELYDFCNDLVPGILPSTSSIPETVDYDVFTTLSSDAKRVLSTSSYGLYIFNIKKESVRDIIPQFFPLLETDFSGS